MQLRHLHIPNFRNLRGVALDFVTHLEGHQGEAPHPIRSHALIGQNGTGKSNLIEALITIFRNIDLRRDAEFDYTLEYDIRGHRVRIQADLSKQKRPFVWVDGDRVSQEYLTTNDPPDKPDRDERRGPRLLPSHIFAYYSGRNERIEALFQDHILRRDGNQTVIDTPDEHPQGMGVTGLLKSDLFGLSSTLDMETERRLFRRNELFVKPDRTPAEDEELRRLSAELADLGFSTSDFRDPDYALFVRKMAQHRRFRKPTLSPEERAEQDRIAGEIIDEILGEEAGE